MEYVNDVNQFKDFDNFFYYGYGNLEVETKSDILQNIMQPKRSLFYDRSQDSAGIPGYENRPNSLYMQINLPFDIATSLGKRNQVVSNGDGDYPDRRIATSQAIIQVKIDKEQTKVTVNYIPLSDFRQTSAISAVLSANI
jgi:hypothetical protein